MDVPVTLAYVFWHWLRADGDVVAYEEALLAFQRALRANAPAGYRRAAVFRQAPAPWLPGTGGHYVDWYVVDGSAALDPLNEAAVSAACASAHAAAAARAEGGTAGLYGLRWGAVPSADVCHATWFSKPVGMSYEALDEDLSALTRGRPVELWSRRMTLGAAPEMCLLAASPVPLSERYGALHVVMRPLWPETHGTPACGDSAEAIR